MSGAIHGASSPAQQRADAGDELADAERLGQVIVGAALQAVHLVGFLAPGGEHQDRHISELRFAADRAGHRDAVEPRQHDVEDHQIERLAARQPEPLRSVRRRDRVEALEAEMENHEVADVLVVLDDEHSGGGAVRRGILPWHSHQSSG
jgi:hypothetical protein